MFQKRYSPVVLSKAATFALYQAERVTRFVLQDKMVRFLHLTMDDMRRDEPSSRFPRYKSEISASILCQKKKVIEVEVEVDLTRRADGEWVVNSHSTLLLPSLRRTRVTFAHGVGDDSLWHYDIWLVNSGHEGSGSSPDDEQMRKLRSELFAA